MPSIASQDLCLAQARNLIPTAQDTEMSFARASDGKVIASAPGAFGLPVDCSYWKEPNVRKGEDGWRYKLTNHGSLSHAGPYSHVSELGCQIAIRSHFVHIGCIKVPQDNSHLDDTDAGILERTRSAWVNKIRVRPSSGDFLKQTDGHTVRFCAAQSTYAQTTTALEHSYYIGVFGDVSYSGGLDPGLDYDRIALSNETMLGRFWFFHHGRGGAGRRIDVFLPCPVWLEIPD